MPVYSIQADPYRGGANHNSPNRKRVLGAHHPSGTDTWTAIDGEGCTFLVIRRNRPIRLEHRYVLLGVGQDQIEDEQGLQWERILQFIYDHQKPRNAFVGFYLGYDFTQWLKTLPEGRARKLLTDEGKASRKSTSHKLAGKYLPVDVGEWQIDILGNKRLMFRHKPCDCLTVKCPHPKGKWVYVCDAGPFFQTSFLNVIDPANWQEPIITDAEYQTILRGKDARATAKLDDDMRFYNRLENEILERVMADLDHGFRRLDVKLAPNGWYGPGQAAQSWMGTRAPRRVEIEERVPEWFLAAARASYFGGWFEIMAHGIIPGDSYENDINNAYPYIISTLPCLLHGTYSQGVGKPPPESETSLTLVHALVWCDPPNSDRYYGAGIGSMLHRNAQGGIARPMVTAGWFWRRELNAAIRAKCVKRITNDRFYSWVRYEPCECQPPLWQVKNLYQMRLEVGKKSSLGKASKLTNNSIYGKTAQSVGSPRFANPVYASLITAGCRTMILDAIATHPGGKENVLMVATDGVYFLDSHPFLTYGTGLGEWETNTRTNLTLFKPGVYWDDGTRQRITAGESAAFKARGINAKEFSASIARVDEAFQAWGDRPPVKDSQWPAVEFRSGFAMTTCLQALARGDWESAGYVDNSRPLIQNADPSGKRRNVWLDRTDPARPIYRSEPLGAGANATWKHRDNTSQWKYLGEDNFESIPYSKRFGMDDPFSEAYTTQNGITPDEQEPGRHAFRVLTGQEK